MFSIKEGRKLVELARKAIESLQLKKPLDMGDFLDFGEKLGVFVTLNMDGELRGCIGFPQPIYELNRGIIEAARSAANSDPRFAPLPKEHLNKITIGISVLTKPEFIEVEKPEEYLDKIVIGSDGLIIRGTFGSGLLLPQVPVEQGWDEKEFLKQICIKAGMEPNAWKDLDNKLFKFQAQIFEEEEPNGKVVEKKL